MYDLYEEKPYENRILKQEVKVVKVKTINLYDEAYNWVRENSKIRSFVRVVSNEARDNNTT